MSELDDVSALDSRVRTFLFGLEVTQCRVDFACTLVFWTSEKEATIRMSWFTLISSVGIEQEFSEYAVDGAVALGLFGQALSDIAIKGDGTLKIQFADGQSVRAEPHPEYENWELHLSDGLTIISAPLEGLIWFDGT